MKSKEQAIFSIDKAIQMISQPSCWTQYALARDKKHRRVPVEEDDAHSFCLAGVIQRVNFAQGLPPEGCRQLVQLLNKICQARFEEKIRLYGSVDDLREFRTFPLSYANDRLIVHSGDAVRLLHLAKVFLEKISASSSSSRKSTTAISLNEEAASTRYAPAYTADPDAYTADPDADTADSEKQDKIKGDKTLYIEEQATKAPPPPPPPATPKETLHSHVDTLLPAAARKLRGIKPVPEKTLSPGQTDGGEKVKAQHRRSFFVVPEEPPTDEEDSGAIKLRDILGED